MNDVEKLIKDTFLNTNNKKIKTESLTEYLTSLEKKELTLFAITQIFVDADYYNLYKVKNLGNRPKKYIIDYISNNLDKILESYIKIIMTSFYFSKIFMFIFITTNNFI